MPLVVRERGTGGDDDRDPVPARELGGTSAPLRASAVDRAVPAAWADPLRQWVVRMTLQRLSDQAIADRERRLLAWIAYHLTMSADTDTALVPRRFLASELRMTAADIEAALDALVGRGFVRPEHARSDEHQLALRLVVQGMNDERREPWEH